MADALAVWLYGDPVAAITQQQRRLQLRYSPEALARFPLGWPLLSLSLPLQPERHPDRVVRPFLDGLLPEGQARLAVAYDLGLDARDTFGLIGALGRDCAGALVIQPLDDGAPPEPTTLRGEQLVASEIEALVANLRTAPLGIGERVRLSLGGVQEKLLLTALPDGSWSRPLDGTPSTHILKPELARFPGTVENEAFSMAVARHLGLAVAEVVPTLIGTRKLLVVTRFDRVVREDGVVDRIHQEDLCQALGVSPTAKYEDLGGPSLRRIARLLQVAAPRGVLEDLLRAVVVHAVLANGDAHGKNFSVLHHRDGVIALSPLYDLLCTLRYGDDRLAMTIGGVERTTALTAPDLIAEARGWGLTVRRVGDIVDDVLERAPDAVALAAAETALLDDEVVACVSAQIGRLRSSPS